MVYVDNLVIIGDYHEGIKALKQNIFQNFRMKDLSFLGYFFRIDISESKLCISISQSKYALDILGKINLIDCKWSILLWILM